MSAFFITLEGGEGAGKTTQAQRLARRLEALGKSVLVTREPGGTPGADAIRQLILSGQAEALGPEVERVLFLASRADHLKERILPALRDGKIVICDRFLDSTRVYQPARGESDAAFARKLEAAVLSDLMPDLTIILDVSAETGASRAATRRGNEVSDRFESEAREAHERRREAFREIARKEPERCVLLDASGDPDRIEELVWSVVSDRLDAASVEAVERSLRSQ